ncbi:MAG TPA: MBL fold metallo-hydrolase [Nocardioides sp.]|nr:MBL fold metallo-hydrolase [Nocardioides sp.]
MTVDVVHHLNCATLRPRGALGGRVAPPAMVAHCLLVERSHGLLLVDTGFGTGDIADPRRLGRPFVAALRPRLEMAETAQAQVRALGLAVDDVTDVAVTHLDLDHAGGLGDFPRARVHVFGEELDAAQAPTMRERARYVGAQWAHGPLWVRHDGGGDDWFGFKAVRAIADDVLLVPLRGHTRGHCGVAVRRPGGGWLLHAGDSYFSSGEKQTPPAAPAGLRAFQRLMAVDNLQRLHNQERLRELHAARGPDVTIFSAHDPSEFAALTRG